jgi:predicted RNA-binding Zn-ribbon protein involved in translation (DUF1610 family)
VHLPNHIKGITHIKSSEAKTSLLNAAALQSTGEASTSQQGQEEAPATTDVEDSDTKFLATTIQKEGTKFKCPNCSKLHDFAKRGNDPVEKWKCQGGCGALWTHADPPTQDEEREMVEAENEEQAEKHKDLDDGGEPST